MAIILYKHAVSSVDGPHTMTEETIATNSVKLNIRPPKPHIMVYTGAFRVFLLNFSVEATVQGVA